MASPTNAAANSTRPAEATIPAESVGALLVGLLAGALVVGLFALIGSARGRQNRAAKQAQQIRGEIYGLADDARAAAEESLPKPKPAKPAYPDERLGNFIRGLLLGALAGGVYGVVKADRSGAAARAQLRETLTDLSHEARGAVTDFSAWAADERPASGPEPTADSLTLRP